MLQSPLAPHKQRQSYLHLRGDGERCFGVGVFSEKIHEASPIFIIVLKTFQLQLMQNVPFTSSKSIRLEKINSLRSSMRQISILSKKTIELENKLSNHHEDSQNLLEKLNSTQDTISNHSDNPEGAAVGVINSFLEKYQLMEKLGQGANACVYKCLHKKSGKIYAAKKLKIEEEHILQLKRNFINLKQLRHPSIIKYKALYLDLSQHCAYLIMECFNKPSLLECAPKDQAQLKRIIRELVKALQYLHHRNICHRDIKPQNILYCSKTKAIRIIDFGISKRTYLKGGRREMLTVIGTPFYEAPQVFLGGGYDEKIDIWALGITIFKLITGYTPFESEYHSATIQKIKKGELSFNDAVWDGYSTHAKRFIARMLKNKDERMTLKEALNHIWLREPQKLQRCKSPTVKLHEEFHEEVAHKMFNGNSKEADTKVPRLLISKRIELIHRTEFDLTDSQQEIEVKSSGQGLKIPRFYSYKQR